MTNKEKATALMAVMGDETRAWAERIAAQRELEALKKGAKVGWEKLGVTQKWLDWFEDSQAKQHDALPMDGEPEGSDPLDEPAGPGHDPAPADLPHQPDALKPPKAKDDPVVQAQAQGEEVPADAAKAAVERGLISAMVRDLLERTDDPYADIEAAVRAKYPHAKTTTRSIASVASDMRKAGRDVAQRRAVAK